MTSPVPPPPPLVLVPGFSGSREGYAFVQPMLARRGIAVAVDLTGTDPVPLTGTGTGTGTGPVDLTGTGPAVLTGTGPREPADLAALVAKVREVVRAQAEPVVLVGASFGALVATAVAATEPRVRGLVLLAGWAAPDARLRDGLDLLLSVGERTPDLLPALAQILLLSPSATTTGAPLLTADPGTTARLIAARFVTSGLAADEEPGADSARLTSVPTLVVAGSADALVSPELTQELVGSFDDVRYAVLDAGHALLAERPAEVLALVERFVDGRLAPGVVPAVQV